MFVCLHPRNPVVRLVRPHREGSFTLAHENSACPLWATPPYHSVVQFPERWNSNCKDLMQRGMIWPRACRFAPILKVSLPGRAEEVVLREESRTAQEVDLNWNGILGMMALMLVSFGLYGAAVGMYFTLTS